MRSFAVAVLVSAVVAAALTPMVRLFALRIGAVSVPGGRHVHLEPIPRLGGIALFVAFLVPLVGLFFVEAGVAETVVASSRRVIGLALGATIMVAVGAVDDLRSLRALHKLLAQMVVAAIAYAAGFRIEAVELPLVGTLEMGVLTAPVTMLWIVGIVNAVNLIDGLDGLAGGVVFFAALTNLVVAILTGSHLAALMSASTIGAVVGFLFHNFNPARIFMGDSGSYFLGYTLAITSLSGIPRASAAVALLVPVLALGVPIFDVLFSMVRRFLERRPLFSPDRGHIHHRLLDAGITHRRAVLILYAVCAVLAGTAIAAHLGRAWQVGVALLVASLTLVALVRVAGIGRRLRPSASRASGADAVDSARRMRAAIMRFVVATEPPISAAALRGALRALGESGPFGAITVRHGDQEVFEWASEPGPRLLRVEPARVLLELSGRPLVLEVEPSADGGWTSEAPVLLALVAERLESAELSGLLSSEASESPAERSPEPRAALAARPSRGGSSPRQSHPAGGNR